MLRKNSSTLIVSVRCAASEINFFPNIQTNCRFHYKMKRLFKVFCHYLWKLRILSYVRNSKILDAAKNYESSCLEYESISIYGLIQQRVLKLHWYLLKRSAKVAILNKWKTQRSLFLQNNARPHLCAHTMIIILETNFVLWFNH